MRVASRVWLFVLMACAGCDSGLQSLSTSRRYSNIETADKSGTIAAQVSKDSLSSQILVASRASNIKDAFVEFPLPAPAADIRVQLSEGADLRAAILADLGLASAEIVRAGFPVFLGSEAVTVLDTSFNLMLPVTLDREDSSSYSDNYSGALQLAVVSLSVTKYGYSEAIIPIQPEAMVGGYVKVTSPLFGWFQLIMTKQSLSAVTKTSLLVPKAKS